MLLSVRNSGIRALLEEAGLSDSLGVAVALMHERSLGNRSRWHGYLKTLDRRADVPIFWSDAELCGLQGTELTWGDSLREDRANLAADFAGRVAPLAARHPKLLPVAHVNAKAFLEAVSVVASRAFYVDDTHGESLVPFADLLNTHAQRLHYEVRPVHLARHHGTDFGKEGGEGGGRTGEERGQGDCGDEGKEGYVGGDVGGKVAGTAGASNGSNSSSVGKRNSGAAEVEDAEEEEAEEEEEEEEACPALHIAFESETVEGTECLCINVVTDIAAGEEVMNCYGVHSNAASLMVYGYTEQWEWDEEVGEDEEAHRHRRRRCCLPHPNPSEVVSLRVENLYPKDLAAAEDGKIDEKNDREMRLAFLLRHAQDADSEKAEEEEEEEGGDMNEGEEAGEMGETMEEGASPHALGDVSAFQLSYQRPRVPVAAAAAAAHVDNGEATKSEAAEISAAEEASAAEVAWKSLHEVFGDDETSIKVLRCLYILHCPSEAFEEFSRLEGEGLAAAAAAAAATGEGALQGAEDANGDDSGSTVMGGGCMVGCMVCQVLSSLGLEDMAAQLDVPALLLTALGDRCEAYGDVSDTKQAGERDPFSIAADLRRLDDLLGEEAKDEAMAEAATVGVGTGAEAGAGGRRCKCAGDQMNPAKRQRTIGGGECGGGTAEEEGRSSAEERVGGKAAERASGNAHRRRVCNALVVRLLERRILQSVKQRVEEVGEMVHTS
jgi:hypothetical protein